MRPDQALQQILQMEAAAQRPLVEQAFSLPEASPERPHDLAKVTRAHAVALILVRPAAIVSQTGKTLEQLCAPENGRSQGRALPDGAVLAGASSQSSSAVGAFWGCCHRSANITSRAGRRSGSCARRVAALACSTHQQAHQAAMMLAQQRVSRAAAAVAAQQLAYCGAGPRESAERQ